MKRARLSRQIAAGLLCAAGWAAFVPAAQADDAPAAGNVAAAAPVVPGRFTFALESQTRWHRDRAYHLFSDDRRHSADGLSLGYDLVRLGERGTLAVGVGWLNESLHGQWAGQNTGDLDVDTFQSNVLARFSVLPWLAPHVRVALGGARAKVRLSRNNGGAEPMTARSWSGTAQVGGGLRARSRAWKPGTSMLPPLAVSLAVEGGFAFASPLSLSARPTPPSDEDEARDQIPGAAVDLGTLGRSHPYFALSLGLHF